MSNVSVVTQPLAPPVVVSAGTAPPTVVVVSTGIPGPAGPPGDLASPEQLTAAVVPAIEAHRTAALPHPAYDDLPDFNLLYENGLV